MFSLVLFLSVQISSSPHAFFCFARYAYFSEIKIFILRMYLRIHSSSSFLLYPISFFQPYFFYLSKLPFSTFSIFSFPPFPFLSLRVPAFLPLSRRTFAISLPIFLKFTRQHSLPFQVTPTSTSPRTNAQINEKKKRRETKCDEDDPLALAVFPQTFLPDGPPSSLLLLLFRNADTRSCTRGTTRASPA